jgi:hypothetical protein
VTARRGEAAKKFKSRIGDGDPQQLMGRVSGNYKRGNEQR